MQTAELIAQNDRLIIKGNLNFDSIINVYLASLPHLHSQKELIVDFKEVTSSNSAGLALIFEWLKHVKQTGQRISFHHIPESLLSIAKAADLDRFLVKI